MDEIEAVIVITGLIITIMYGGFLINHNRKENDRRNKQQTKSS